MKIQYSHGFLMIFSAGRVQKWGPGWVLGPKMAQNGTKLAPNWTQNGPKWTQNGSQLDPNWTQTGPKLAQAARPGPAGPGLGTVRGSKNCKIAQHSFYLQRFAGQTIVKLRSIPCIWNVSRVRQFLDGLVGTREA